MATLSTIDWMVDFIGDAHCARRKDIIREGFKAGHNASTLKNYLGSALFFGHVDPDDCTMTGFGTSQAPRPIYFRRRSKGHYKLSVGGETKFVNIVIRCMLTEKPEAVVQSVDLDKPDRFDYHCF